MRNRKKIINGEIVAKRKASPQMERAVVLPDNPTWLKQPNVITLMNYDYKILQQKTLICIIEKVQCYIEEYLRGKEIYQMLPFKENVEKESVTFKIKYSELGIAPQNYSVAKKLLKEISFIPVEVIAPDPVTGKASWSLRSLMTPYIPLEPYTKEFYVEIDKHVLEIFINVDKGFTRYMKEIANSTDNKYTVRLYMLISSWKNKGGFSITMKKFRKWLGIEDKYKNYKDLYKRVIKPAYEELYEKADCWFDVEAVYLQKRDCEPDKLRFQVINATLSKSEQMLLEKQKDMIARMAAVHLRMEDRHITKVLELINLSNSSYVLDKVSFLAGYIDKNIHKITDPAEYCMNALLKALTPQKGLIGDDIQ